MLLCRPSSFRAGVSDIISYTLNGGLTSLASDYEEYFSLGEVAVSGDQ